MSTSIIDTKYLELGEPDFFAINFLGDFESRIRDIINVLPSTAWPLDDQFVTILK